jgi:hypothetical protein
MYCNVYSILEEDGQHAYGVTLGRFHVTIFTVKNNNYYIEGAYKLSEDFVTFLSITHSERNI